MRGGTSNRVTYNTNDSGFRVQNAEGNGVSDVRLGAAWGRPGVYSSTYLSLGSDGTYIEFVTNNSQRGYIDSSSNLFAFGSMRSPIFYDSNNTGYYLDPASTSVFSNVQAIKTYQTERYLDVPGSNDGSYRWVRFPMGWFNGGGMSAEIAISRSINDAGPYGGCTSRFIINSREWHSGQDNMWYFYTEHGSNNAANGAYGYYIYQAGPRDLASGGYWFYMRLLSGVRYRMSVSADMNFNGNQMGGPEYDVADPGGIERITLGTGVIGNNGNYNRVYSQYGFYSSDVRTPVYYDSNDTSYFINPNGQSNLYFVNAPTGYVSNGNPWGTANSAFFPNGITTAGSTNWIYGSNTYIGNAPSNGAGHEFFASGSSNSTGDVSAFSSMRAPIFYDRNDTYYYLDPNSTSRVNVLGSFSLRNNYTVDVDHTYGIYFDSGGSNGYAIYRESGAWAFPYPDLRISFHTGIKLGANASYNGIRFYTDTDMGTQVMSVNNVSDGVGAGNVYVNNTLVAGDSLRATIFYDSNNTAFYLNPNSTGWSSYNAGGAVFRNIQISSDSLTDTIQNVSSGGNIWLNYGHNGPVGLGFGGGLTTAYSGLVVSGTSSGFTLNVTGNAQIIRSGTSTALIAGLSGVTGSVIRFSYNGGFVGSISTDGSNTAYNTSSDYRLKEDLKPIDKPLEKVLNLNPLNFKYKSSGIRQDGFIAHELQEILPYIVTGEKDAVDEFGDPVYQEVDYSKLTPILIAAIKELKKEIDTLKAN